MNEPMTTEELVALAFYVRDSDSVEDRERAMAYWPKEQPELREGYRVAARHFLATVARSDGSGGLPSTVLRRASPYHVWAANDVCTGCGMRRDGYGGGHTGSTRYTDINGVVRDLAGECSAAAALADGGAK